MDASFTSRVLSHLTSRTTTAETRILLVLGLAVGAHVTVWILRRGSEWTAGRGLTAQSRIAAVVKRPKLVTIRRLIVSALIFAIYFFALGLILQELGINLTAYLASASVLGLAISFGSQGLVQDIVIGLTLILLDAMDVGDMVEIVGSATVVGIVEEIGLRFTQVTNFYNQRVLIPNRTIANVSRFPHGGVDVYADVWIPAGADREKVAETLEGLANGMRAQFSEIILGEPVVGEPQSRSGGHWNFFRILFRIWPGQGALIETTFRQEVVKAMKAFDPNYADWQVPVTYRAGTGTSPGRRINKSLESSSS
jgi:small conductance mechanosensitive channel